MRNKILLSLMIMAAIPSFALAQERAEDKAQKSVREPEVNLEKQEIKIKDEKAIPGLAKESNATSSERRSQVANAIREMLQVTDKHKGIGEKVREIAGKHEKNNNDIEDGIKEIKNRGQFRKFLFGPNYKKISDVEAILKNQAEKLAELRQLLSQVTNEKDKVLLEQRISEMENIKAEMEKEVTDEQKGFSLFGWLNKMINKK